MHEIARIRIASFDPISDKKDVAGFPCKILQTFLQAVGDGCFAFWGDFIDGTLDVGDGFTTTAKINY